MKIKPLKKKVNLLFEPTFGLYIARDSVSLVLLGRSFRGPRLIANVSKPIEKEVPFPRKIKSAFLLLKEFVASHKTNGWSLYVGFESDLAVLRTLTLPITVKENLKGAISYELENYVPFNADDVFFDCHLIEEDKTTDKINVLLVVTKKEIVERIVDDASEFGFSINGIEIGATSLANALLSKKSEEDSPPRALLFLEKSWLEVAILDGAKVIYGKTFDISEGNSSTSNQIWEHLEDISESLGVGLRETSIILYGPGVTEEILENLNSKGLNVLNTESIQEELKNNGLIFAYGMAVKALSKVPVQINLLPKHLRRKPSRFSQYVMLALCLMLIISVIGWWGSGIAKQRMMLKRLDSQLERLQRQVKKVEEKRVKCQELAKQIETVRQIIESPITPLDVLRELTARIPEGAWLKELYISGKKVQIAGYADVATELIPMLENSPIFHDVAFSSPVSKDRNGKERFRIEFEID